jgi:hypothetical protein
LSQIGRRSERDSRSHQQLPKNRAGALSFLKNLACFVGLALCISAQKQALRVTENARERVAEFERDAGDHLAERGELFGLQKLRLKDSLRSEVAINFDAAKPFAITADDGPARAFQDTRHRTQQLDFISHAGLSATGQFTPAI